MKRAPIKISLTTEAVRELFRYDPDTGALWRVITRGNSVWIEKAGSVRKSDGYVAVKIAGVPYMAHRLIWLIMTGEWPAFEVDHEDLDRSNNRWRNLREATRPQNVANAGSRRIGKLKGVSRTVSQRFRAQICVAGKNRHLGTYDTDGEAHTVYSAAIKQAFGEFGRA